MILNDFCRDNRQLGPLLRGLYRSPYFKDDDSEEAGKYMGSRYFIKKSETETECHGLAASYLHSVPGIGFCSESFWDRESFDLIIKNGEKKNGTVICLSREEHADSEAFRNWLENNGELKLLETPLSFEEKSINLRDDHGKDILLDFGKKILRSPYVIEVMNSLPFNPTQKSFIKKVLPDGKIELVLYKTDQGLGMVIQTTGRNMRETEAIAKIIEKMYP